MTSEHLSYPERAQAYAETLSTRLKSGILKSFQDKSLWNLYKMEQDDTGNWHKRPYQPNGRPASTNMLQQWSSLDNVLEALAKATVWVDGIGILLPPPYVLIDLDAKETPIYDREKKKIISPLAMRIMQTVPTYFELSPHRGLHGITEGYPKRGNFKKPELEMYTNWFATVTARHIPGTPFDVVPHQSGIEALEDEFHPITPENLIQNTGGRGKARLTALPPEASNDPVLQELLAGGMSMVGNDHHRADWWLLAKLLHWTGDDKQLTKSIFLASPLGQRAKARPGTRESRRGNTNYVDRTIDRIIQMRENPPMRR